MSRISRLVIPLTILLLALAAAAPAEARWRIANGNDASEMVASPGFTEQQTCSDRLRGAAGWTTFPTGDPLAEPLPRGAFSGTRYEVWKAPPGFDDFAEATADFDSQGNRIGYHFTDPNTAEEIPATSVVDFTTAPRARLVTPIALKNGVYVYSEAPIYQALPNVQPGDVLGLKPRGGASFVTLAAVQCTDTGEFTVSDFFGAVDAVPTVNVGEAGASYQVRWRLINKQGATVTRKSAVIGITYSSLECSTFSGNPTDVIEREVTGPSVLRFSDVQDQFIYRWQTPSSPGCYRLKLIFDSGQHRILNFDLN